MAILLQTRSSVSLSGRAYTRQKEIRANSTALKRLAIQYQNGVGVKRHLALALRLAETHFAKANFELQQADDTDCDLVRLVVKQSLRPIRARFGQMMCQDRGSIE